LRTRGPANRGENPNLPSVALVIALVVLVVALVVLVVDRRGTNP